MKNGSCPSGFTASSGTHCTEMLPARLSTVSVSGTGSRYPAECSSGGRTPETTKSSAIVPCKRDFQPHQPPSNRLSTFMLGRERPESGRVFREGQYREADGYGCPSPARRGEGGWTVCPESPC